MLQNYKVQVEAETTSYIFPNPEFPIVWIDVPNGEEYLSERSLANNEEAILIEDLYKELTNVFDIKNKEIGICTFFQLKLKIYDSIGYPKRPMMRMMMTKKKTIS